MVSDWRRPRSDRRAAAIARRRSGSAGSSPVATPPSGSPSARSSARVFEPEDLGFLGWIAVDFIQRRAIGDRAGAGDLRSHRVLVPELQCRDQRPQGQALNHQRAQHHGERRQQNEIAIRETFRQRIRRRQRDDAAHPHQDTTMPPQRWAPPSGAWDERYPARRTAWWCRKSSPRRCASNHGGEHASRHRAIFQPHQIVEPFPDRRSCIPISMNASTLSTNTAVSHTA